MRSFFSAKNVFTTKTLVVLAMLAAVKFILTILTDHFVDPTYRLISFSHLPGAVVAILYGPWAGIIFGFVSDTVGFIAKPMGPYFPGYALGDMVTNFIYALFLFRRPITVRRVVIARVLILVIVIFGLNFLWSTILYGAVAAKYFNYVRISTNLLQLPLQVVAVYAVGHMALRVEKATTLSSN